MASSPKPPKPVDPNVAAQAQAQWNRFGQRGPGGSVTWEGEGPNQTQVTQWDPRTEALFGQLQGIAGQERQQYAAPEGFSQFRDGLMSRMNDRQQMGRPVYQPTQTFGGTLGPNSAAGGAGGGGAGGIAQPPGEGGMWGGDAGPQIQANFGMPQGKPVDMSGGGVTMGKPALGPQGGPGVMQKPDIGGQTQPVPPDGKGLLGAIGGMMGGQQTETPWKDAFMGATDEQGQRHPFRNALNGGLVGALGRGIGNSLVNRGGDGQTEGRPMGGAALDRQLGQLAMPGTRGERFNAQYGVGSGGGIDRTLARIAEQAASQGLTKPGQKPKPGNPGRPVMGLPRGSTRGRAMGALGMGNQIWGAAQDRRALEDMNIHGRGIPEEQ